MRLPGLSSIRVSGARRAADRERVERRRLRLAGVTSVDRLRPKRPGITPVTSVTPRNHERGNFGHQCLGKREWAVGKVSQKGGERPHADNAMDDGNAQ